MTTLQTTNSTTRQAHPHSVINGRPPNKLPVLLPLPKPTSPGRELRPLPPAKVSPEEKIQIATSPHLVVREGACIIQVDFRPVLTFSHERSAEALETFCNFWVRSLEPIYELAALNKERTEVSSRVGVRWMGPEPLVTPSQKPSPGAHFDFENPKNAFAFEHSLQTTLEYGQLQKSLEAESKYLTQLLWYLHVLRQSGGALSLGISISYFDLHVINSEDDAIELQILAED